MSADYHTVLEKVCAISRRELGISQPHIVTEESSFRDDLGTDSLDTVELVMTFEEEFNIEIPETFGESVVTVGDAAKQIVELLNEQTI